MGRKVGVGYSDKKNIQKIEKENIDLKKQLEALQLKQQKKTNG